MFLSMDSRRRFSADSRESDALSAEIAQSAGEAELVILEKPGT